MKRVLKKLWLWFMKLPPIKWTVIRLYDLVCLKDNGLGDPRNLKIFYIDKFSLFYGKTNTVGLTKAYSKIGWVETFDIQLLARRFGCQLANDMLMKKILCFRPDLIHIGKIREIQVDTIRNIKNQISTFVVLFFGDLLLPGELENKYLWILKLSQYADIMLKMQDDPDVNDELEQHGIQTGFWISGTDPEVFYPRDIDRDHDVAFLANNMYKRKGHEERRQLVQAILSKGISLHLYGYKWEYLKNVPNANLHPFVNNEQFALACSQVKITLNYNGFSEHKIRLATSWRRMFNAMACGSLHLTLYFPGLEEIFGNKKHLICFNSIPEAIELIEYYLANDDERRKIAEVGRQEVLAHHTWDIRLAEMLEMMRSISPKKVEQQVTKI